MEDKEMNIAKIENKEILRDIIEKDVENFLKNGGTITECSASDSAYDPMSGKYKRE